MGNGRRDCHCEVSGNTVAVGEAIQTGITPWIASLRSNERPARNDIIYHYPFLIIHSRKARAGAFLGRVVRGTGVGIVIAK
ncbi:MAG: hypothetical protein LBT00_06020 [Spirochaetaceae bacterium]|nr:hypothetical protein [Spirochaetaceae bacterium]